MKKILMIMAAVLFACSIFAQSEVKEYNASTVDRKDKARKEVAPFQHIQMKGVDKKIADYLKYNFEERKERYIGKPFSEILKDCKVPVTSMTIGDARSTIYTGTDFHFDDKKKSGKRKIKERSIPYMHITWQTPIEKSEIEQGMRQYGSDWKAFFGQQIVADINIRNAIIAPFSPEKGRYVRSYMWNWWNM